MGEANVQKSKSKYPLGFYVSCLTYTFERFAFYGSKPLLILFLITAVNRGGLGIDKVGASVVAVNLTAFTYVAPIIGGFICDHWLGARYAVSLGCLLMGVGYLFGWKANDITYINLMIYVVSIGTGLFKGNLAALMGRLFDDPDILDSAFSIQYSFVNIGSMFGSAVTGFLYLNTFKHGDVYGFRPVFLVCGIIVLIGGVFFTLMYGSLQGQGKKPFKYITDEHGNITGQAVEGNKDDKNANAAPLTKVEKKKMWAIIFVSFVSIIFWLFYYQQDIALTIYMTEFVNLKAGNFDIAPSYITTTWNGVLCVVLSLVAAKLWAKLSERPQGDLSMFQKVTLSFVFLGIAYVVLVAMETVRGVGAPSTSKVSSIWLFVFGIFLTIGEICFSPLGNSFVSKNAPKKYLSLMMGVWIIATFAATKINGYTTAFVESLGIYKIFVTFTIVSFVMVAILFLMTKTLNKLLEDE